MNKMLEKESLIYNKICILTPKAPITKHSEIVLELEKDKNILKTMI